MLHPPRPLHAAAAAALLVWFGACGNHRTAAGVVPTLSFATPQIIPTGAAGGRSLRLVDLTRDGVLDALIANAATGTWSVLLGRGDGTMVAAPQVGASDGVDLLAVGDFDGDRRPDVVVAAGATGAFALALGRGDGEFEPPRAGVLPWPAAAIAVADVDGDRRVDLVAVARDVAEFAVLAGDGLGWLRPVRVVGTPFVASDAVVADVDGDRVADLVLAAIGRAEIATVRRGGLPPVSSAVPALGGRIAAADFDGDRRTDLVATDASGMALVVLRGEGNGAFAALGTYRAASTPVTSLACGDLDGDGRADVAATAAGRVLMALGDGQGGLSLPDVIAGVAANPDSIAVADVRGEGRADVAWIAGGTALAVARSRAPLPAGLETFGAGTPDCAGRIGMAGNGVPRVGNAQFAYTTTNAPADAPGMLVQGGPPLPAGIDPGLGVVLHVESLLASRLVLSDVLGAATSPEAIPATPALAGTPVHVQTLWLVDAADTCSRSPVGLVSSRGLTVVIQP